MGILYIAQPLIVRVSKSQVLDASTNVCRVYTFSGGIVGRAGARPPIMRTVGTADFGNMSPEYAHPAPADYGNMSPECVRRAPAPMQLIYGQLTPASSRSQGNTVVRIIMNVKSLSAFAVSVCFFFRVLYPDLASIGSVLGPEAYKSRNTEPTYSQTAQEPMTCRVCHCKNDQRWQPFVRTRFGPPFAFRHAEALGWRFRVWLHWPWQSQWSPRCGRNTPRTLGQRASNGD